MFRNPGTTLILIHSNTQFSGSPNGCVTGHILMRNVYKSSLIIFRLQWAGVGNKNITDSIKKILPRCQTEQERKIYQNSRSLYHSLIDLDKKNILWYIFVNVNILVIEKNIKYYLHSIKISLLLKFTAPKLNNLIIFKNWLHLHVLVPFPKDNLFGFQMIMSLFPYRQILIKLYKSYIWTFSLHKIVTKQIISYILVTDVFWK